MVRLLLTCSPENGWTMQDSYDLWVVSQTINLEGAEPVDFDAA